MTWRGPDGRFVKAPERPGQVFTDAELRKGFDVRAGDLFAGILTVAFVGLIVASVALIFLAYR